MQRCHKAVWTHDHWPFRQLVVALVDTLEIISRGISLPDSTRGEVHDLVAVAANVSVEFCYTEVCPVATDHGEDVSKGVGSVWLPVSKPFSPSGRQNKHTL